MNCVNWGDNGQEVSLSFCHYSHNFSNIRYCMTARLEGVTGELYFGYYRDIVDCRIFDKFRSSCASVDSFKQAFGDLVHKVVPLNVYNHYFKAMDMGPEGITREADDMEALKNFKIKRMTKKYL